MLLKKDLNILFVGINPSLTSVSTEIFCNARNQLYQLIAECDNRLEKWTMT